MQIFSISGLSRDKNGGSNAVYMVWKQCSQMQYLDELERVCPPCWIVFQ